MIVYLKVYKVNKDLLSCFKWSNLQLTLIKILFPFCFDICKTKHDLMQRVRTTKNEQSHLKLWWFSGLKLTDPKQRIKTNTFHSDLIVFYTI